MKRAVPFAAVLLAITAGAAALRLVDLDNRPMHWDEANQALKFGRLLERGQYEYDPEDHHGPSLNDLTLPIARLASAEDLTQVTETHLRLLPAIFGILLVGLVWLLRDELGRPAAVWAAVLTAVSPAMVFYSRYYIQEMLLVCFTFGAMAALWRCSRAKAAAEENEPRIRRWAWLVLLGLCIGMMHASKETCVIPLFAMGLAAVATIPGVRRMLTIRGLKETMGVRGVLSVLVVLIAAAGVSALFFSSFFTHAQGVVDSVTAYSIYFDRASGQGSAGWHDQPWYHYFHLLFWWQRGDGPLWTEASIAVLALVGLLAAALGKGMKPAAVPFARFAAIYTLVMIAVYSAISYKTPWCALGFLHGMILLAGVGAAVLIGLSRGYVWKGITTALLIAAAGHLAWQAHRASFEQYADVNNPYVYAHTTEDVLRLVQQIKEIAAVHPDAEAMHVQVICPDYSFWPLPWYLRDMPRVEFSAEIPAGLPAPLIIAPTQMEIAVMEYAFTRPPPGQRPLYNRLMTEDAGIWELSPGLYVTGYLQSDLLNAYLAQQPE
ncbi:MAG TPA: flippase activity-associated protein Agl23 [Thermoguttaceae bacterium]|nr:flippase activity-associated protein Agl23 [Thermoguttaceae bacterium]